MTSISAIGTAATAVYPASRAAAPRSVDSTATPNVDPAERANNLARQLDATLADRLERIRQQITPVSDGTQSGQSVPRRLDIRA